MKYAPSFVDKIDKELKEYQLEKILKKEYSQGRKISVKQKEAKDALIALDDENDITRNSDQEVEVGRWSSYKVPQKVEERLSLNRKIKKSSMANIPTYRYMESVRGNPLPQVCRSQRTIPKLKVILHQLDCPLGLQIQRQMGNKARVFSQSSSKMKNYVGSQALVISNKQEIKPSLKSQRKSLTTTTASQFFQNIENRRPPTAKSSFRGQSVSNGYQKIKRPFGNPEHGQVYEKQILSQLIKSNIKQNQNTIAEPTVPLSNMLNYFTMSSSDTKKKITSKLGLDKLLS